MFIDIETPAVLIDVAVAGANIDRFQSYCNRHGLACRPHIKTHKLPRMAIRQIKAGAVGITCQKVSEAEAMLAEADIDDVLITYNILGDTKLERLRQIAHKTKLSVVTDSTKTVDGLSAAFKTAEDQLTVLVECDTGAERCGVQTPADAAELASYVDQQPGLTFGGLMTYPPVGRSGHVNAWLNEAKQLAEASGLSVPVISNGGSPDMWQAHDVAVATEHRAGTYIYNDRSLVARKVATFSDCALTVLATVVSVPTAGRAVIDAGTKVLTSDLLGLEGHGHVLRRPDICIEGLSEEHGVLCADEIGLAPGDRVRIVPNHACVVSNMVDEVHLVEGAATIGPTSVVARGKVQ